MENYTSSAKAQDQHGKKQMRLLYSDRANTRLIVHKISFRSGAYNQPLNETEISVKINFLVELIHRELNKHNAD